MPFLNPLGSIFPPNLPPKIHQNPSKIDAKMPSQVDSIFWSFFDGFLLPTSTPRTSKIKPPLQREHDFSKNRYSHFASIFHRFWCQHASIFGPKIHQNPSKNRSQNASIFRSILASVFYWFLLDFRSQLGAMLGTISLKMGGACGVLASSLLGLCSLSVFWPSWPPLGAIWARFWEVLGSIWEGFGLEFGSFWWHLENRRLLLENLSLSFGSSWKTCSFDPFCWRLVLDGLVGLREAQRIFLS